MALELVTTLDMVQVLEDGSIQVRRATWLVQDGKRLKVVNYTRVAYEAERNVDDEDPLVKAVAGAANQIRQERQKGKPQ